MNVLRTTGPSVCGLVYGGWQILYYSIAYVCVQQLYYYSGIFDNGGSEIRTPSLQRTQLEIPCKIFLP